MPLQKLKCKLSLNPAYHHMLTELLYKTDYLSLEEKIKDQSIQHMRSNMNGNHLYKSKICLSQNIGIHYAPDRLPYILLVATQAKKFYQSAQNILYMKTNGYPFLISSRREGIVQQLYLMGNGFTQLLGTTQITLIP